MVSLPILPKFQPSHLTTAPPQFMPPLLPWPCYTTHALASPHVQHTKLPPQGLCTCCPPPISPTRFPQLPPRPSASAHVQLQQGLLCPPGLCVRGGSFLCFYLYMYVPYLYKVHRYLYACILLVLFLWRNKSPPPHTPSRFNGMIRTDCRAARPCFLLLSVSASSGMVRGMGAPSVGKGPLQTARA